MAAWLSEHLPAPLVGEGLLGMLHWQWAALLPLAAVAWALGVLLRSVTHRVLRRIAAHTDARWDDELVARLKGPLTFGWTLGALGALVPFLELPARAAGLFERGLRAGVLAVVFWALSRGIDVVRDVLGASAWAREHRAAAGLLPLGARVAKVLVLAMAVVAFLSELGYPVVSLLAGLGIGGLALAFGAQKTVENLFGAFSLGADQPFREGDFVRVEDLVGTVEAIGLRSTRIRTLDRTLVTIPNGKLADMRLESYSARDRFRFACTVALVYGTSAAVMRDVLAGLERVLRAHPRIWQEDVVVRLRRFGESALEVEVMAWFEVPDFGAFRAVRQEVLLEFMRVVEECGSAFAFPTRTVHVATPLAAAHAAAGRDEASSA